MRSPTLSLLAPKRTDCQRHTYDRHPLGHGERRLNHYGRNRGQSFLCPAPKRGNACSGPFAIDPVPAGKQRKSTFGIRRISGFLMALAVRSEADIPVVGSLRSLQINASGASQMESRPSMRVGGVVFQRHPRTTRLLERVLRRSGYQSVPEFRATTILAADTPAFWTSNAS